MKTKVLKLLREHDNQFISGQRLSEVLSCSRTMVWKHIDALRKEGYKIIAISNKGYQLKDEPVAGSISEHGILSEMDEETIFQRILVKDSVDSTQRLANELVSKGAASGTVVLAEEQIGGRGRLGREWYSPRGTGVWMSLILKPNLHISQTPQLTLLTAVAVARGLEKVTTAELEIKWPNDLLLNGKKVCGILTELQADPDKVKSVIIGIGINALQTSFPSELKDTATSLKLEMGMIYDRMEIIRHILSEFHWLYEEYNENGFQTIKSLWEAKCETIGKKITAKTTQGTYQGLAEGINEDGVLLLRDDRGEVQHIYSADIESSNN